MAVISPPYVNFLSNPVLNIGSTPTIILGSEHACIIDSILLTNVTSNNINVSLYILREVDDIGVQFPLPTINIASLAYTDVLYNTTLTIQAGDILYAYSDFSSNLFNSCVSYRQLVEL